jgi:hypothetical protein
MRSFIPGSTLPKTHGVLMTSQTQSSKFDDAQSELGDLFKTISHLCAAIQQHGRLHQHGNRVDELISITNLQDQAEKLQNQLRGLSESISSQQKGPSVAAADDDNEEEELRPLENSTTIVHSLNSHNSTAAAAAAAAGNYTAHLRQPKQTKSGLLSSLSLRRSSRRVIERVVRVGASHTEAAAEVLAVAQAAAHAAAAIAAAAGVAAEAEAARASEARAACSLLKEAPPSPSSAAHYHHRLEVKLADRSNWSYLCDGDAPNKARTTTAADRCKESKNGMHKPPHRAKTACTSLEKWCCSSVPVPHPKPAASTATAIPKQPQSSFPQDDKENRSNAGVRTALDPAGVYAPVSF